MPRFPHLLAALCRALNIPARFPTGTDYGANVALGPPDMVDPSGTAIPMGFIRFGTGRDAADVAFATIFGSVTSWAPWIQTAAADVPAA